MNKKVLTLSKGWVQNLAVFASKILKKIAIIGGYENCSYAIFIDGAVGIESA